MSKQLCGKCPWVGGCCIFLLKSFGSGPLCNWFSCLLENLSCLQCFCAFSCSGTSGYWFLIIHCVDCYVLIFCNLLTDYFNAPLEVVAVLISWSTLEVGIRYFSDFACFSMRGALAVSFWIGLIVPFENIALTASMSANCELQIISWASLSAAVKNRMACVILSSAVICGWVRYLCKQSAVSVIINAFFRLSPVYTFNAGELVRH